LTRLTELQILIVPKNAAVVLAVMEKLLELEMKREQRQDESYL
jgi:hypothetical protein